MARARWMLFPIVGCLLGGCSVHLAHGPLRAADPPRSGDIAIEPRSVGINGKVGWGRFTLFYIPLVPIYVVGDANQEMALQIQHALEQVGYRVCPAPTGDRSAGPKMRATVERFWFNNYTWFFPLVPTWGRIEVHLDLFGIDGEEVWSRTFSASGNTLNFFNGFSVAANQAMDAILTDMVDEFDSKEFFHLIDSLQGTEGALCDAVTAISR